MWARIYRFIVSKHGTKSIGFVSGFIALLAGLDFIPANHLKYYMGLGAVLTYIRGQINTWNQDDIVQAAEVIEQKTAS
jgi:hypothetical protein